MTNQRKKIMDIQTMNILTALKKHLDTYSIDELEGCITINNQHFQINYSGGDVTEGNVMSVKFTDEVFIGGLEKKKKSSRKIDWES